MVAQKFGIAEIQFTDHIKPKKKEDQSMESLLLSRGSKMPMGGDTETKCRADTERKAIKRLSHLRIYPIDSYQTHTLLWMPTSAC